VRGVGGHDGISKQAKEAFRRGLDARLQPLFARQITFRRVQHFGVHFRRASVRIVPMQRAAHLFGCDTQIAQLFPHHRQGFAGRRLGMEHVQNDADQDLFGRTVPEILMAPIAGGIDDDLDDVLHVAHFIGAAAHLEQRIEGGGVLARWRKAQHRPERLAEAGRSGKAVAVVAVGEFSLDIEPRAFSKSVVAVLRPECAPF
jgi:hypothetical protein